jgi:hypothetical protein
MSNLVKFMMTMIALAFLAYLNSGILAERHRESSGRLAIPTERKLPV